MDDDGPAIVLNTPDLTIEEGGNGTWTVTLATEPTANVTVTIPDVAGVTVNPNTLTFTSMSWNMAQTVTVMADQDDDIADATVTLAHNAAGWWLRFGDSRSAGDDQR